MYESMSGKNLFDLVPIIDERITTENEGELIVITFPRFRCKIIQKYLVREKAKIVRVRLEEHGTAVWKKIDGKRNIATIAEMLSDHFNNEENYEYRVATFFSQILEKGFIKIMSSPGPVSSLDSDSGVS